MQYAQSVLLGGSLIDAQTVTHDDTKELLCKCPECGNDVYLVKQHERLSKLGKHIQVPSSWKHYPQHKLLADNCELRVNNYKKQVIEKHNLHIKNKLEKIYKYKLIDIIMYYNHYTFSKNDYSEMFYLTFKERYFKEVHNLCLDIFLSEIKNKLSKEFLEETTVYTSAIQEFKTAYQTPISKEHFLFLKKHYPPTYINYLKTLQKCETLVNYTKNIAMEAFLWCVRHYNRNNWKKLFTTCYTTWFIDQAQSIIKKQMEGDKDRITAIQELTALFVYTLTCKFITVNWIEVANDNIKYPKIIKNICHN